MANFVLLFTGGSAGRSEAERAKVMEAWGGWFGKLGDKVERLLTGSLQRLQPVTHQLDLVAFRGQDALECRGQARVVFDHQDP